MSLFEYILLAASSLFVIVDPVASIPAFPAMTPTDTPGQRIKMARLAWCWAFVKATGRKAANACGDSLRLCGLASLR